jgi:cell division protein FtsZ
VPNRHLLGRDLVHGLGCNGDLELAREIVAREEARVSQVSRGCDFIVLILGLAGATGVALADRLIELGHEAGAKVIVIGVQPFGFEGIARRERSIAAIADLRGEADSVLVLAHDRIAENPATVKNIRHGFHLMHQLMAGITQALSQIVCKRGLIQLSFADVRSLYGRYRGSEVLENCWAAHVEGDIHDRTQDLVSAVLASPLLSDESIWKRVDHALVAVSGTRDLALSDVQEMVTDLKQRLPADIPIATSASLDEETHDKVRVTVLLATTAEARLSVPEIVAAAENPKPTKKPRPVKDTALLTLAPAKPKAPPKIEPEPVVAEIAPKKPKAAPKPTAPPEPVVVENLTITEEEELIPPQAMELEPPITTPSAVAPPRASRRFLAKQEEMSFEGPPRGRFEKTHETMYRGENLDQPTFRRRGLKIRV